MAQHVIIGKETAWGTWVTPTKAIPVINFSGSVGRSRIEGRYSGASRGVYGRWPGAKEPSGSLEMPLWSELLGYFLYAAQFEITTSTPSGATTTREHGCLPIDDPEIVRSLSIQAQHGGTHAVNYLGVVADKLTLSVKAKEAATLALDWKARDEAPAGVAWDYDGTTVSDALIANPIYFARTLRPYIFTDATLVTGGTVALDGTKKQFTVTGGTARTKLDNLEIALSQGFDLPIFNGAPTPGAARAGDRSVTGKFDYDLSTMNRAFYDEYRAGTQVALQLTLTGPVIETTLRRKFVVTLPLIDFDDASWPEIAGGNGRQVRSVAFTAIQDPTSGYDIGCTIADTQTAY
jgi:hypothetical protein